MTLETLKIEGCLTTTPRIFSDSRGDFFEWFQESTFQNATGQKFDLVQANCSISKKGVIRGIHSAKVPPGQAKYVTCFSGSVLDVMVDLRKGSPTFGAWESIEINSREPRVVYLPNGIGHAFMALEDNSIFAYLCDQKYNPENEFAINPFDETLNIDWPKTIEKIVSEKDATALSFEESFNLLTEY